MTTQLLDAALQYGRRGWRVFPVHTTVAGACSCGQACASPGKHPRVKAWQKVATADPAQIERWWRRWPQANVGIATGGGLIVVDIDSPANAALLAALWAGHAALGETLQAVTGRGRHIYLAGDLGGSRTIGAGPDGKGGLLVRCAGGYVLAPPSWHANGRHYRWQDQGVGIAQAPSWFIEAVQAAGGVAKKPKIEPARLGTSALRPAYMQQNQAVMPTLCDKALWILDGAWSPDLDREVKEALEVLDPAMPMDPWVRVGMALRWLDWPDDLGLELWRAWSSEAPDKYKEHEIDTRWRSFRRGGGTTIRTLFGMVRDGLWPRARRPTPETLQAAPPLAADQGFGSVNGFHSLAGAASTIAATPKIYQIRWVDTDKDGNPKSTCTNARIAIGGLGIVCRHDVFTDRLFMGGHAIAQWAGELSDNAVLMLRSVIKTTFRFDPGPNHARDAAVQTCLANQVNPVVDYLGALRWDGRDRIARWVVDYLGCPDEPLGAEFGRLMLVAAVRRARRPGTKFDQIIVLEGREGTGKSTALRILAGEHFSDQRVLGMREREQQEASAGVWIHEIAELAGMRRADVEHVKAFASRQEDRARPSYGRFRVDRPRQTVFCATTNAASYLKSDTGDRRFWPLQTGRIDLPGLERDRNQLWAEAAASEARGDTITLDERFYAAASRAQAARQELDPWSEDIENWIEKHQDTTIRDVLTLGLQIEIKHCTQIEMNRAARVLRNLGFERYQKRETAGRTWHYRRPTP